MRILSVANQKGGVGKSTLSLHLAWYAAASGLRTVLLDFDGQGNSTATLTDSPEGTAAAQLFDEDVDLIPQEVGENLSLIHANTKINDCEALPLMTIKNPANNLRALSEYYDLCVIDTPPALGIRLVAALCASDKVVTPMRLTGFSLQGLSDLLKTIINVQNKLNPKLAHIGILVNEFQSRSKNQKASLKALIKELPDRVLPYYLTSRVSVSDAVDSKKPVWRGTKGQSTFKAAKEMRKACNKIIEEVMK